MPWVTNIGSRTLCLQGFSRRKSLLRLEEPASSRQKLETQTPKRLSRRCNSPSRSRLKRRILNNSWPGETRDSKWLSLLIQLKSYTTKWSSRHRRRRLKHNQLGRFNHRSLLQMRHSSLLGWTQLQCREMYHQIRRRRQKCYQQWLQKAFHSILNR